MHRTSTTARTGVAEPRPRTLHVIDLENELGGSRFTAADVDLWWRIYRQDAVGVRPDDHVMVATGRRSAAEAWFALPSTVQRLVRRGRDGADLALLAAVDVEHAARRFGRLVIASGDHAFAPLALEARRRGLAVHQVLGRGASATVLSLACPTRIRIRTTG